MMVLSAATIFVHDGTTSTIFNDGAIKLIIFSVFPSRIIHSTIHFIYIIDDLIGLKIEFTHSITVS